MILSLHCWLNAVDHKGWTMHTKGSPFSAEIWKQLSENESLDDEWKCAIWKFEPLKRMCLVYITNIISYEKTCSNQMRLHFGCINKQCADALHSSLNPTLHKSTENLPPNTCREISPIARNKISILKWSFTLSSASDTITKRFHRNSQLQRVLSCTHKKSIRLSILFQGLQSQISNRSRQTTRNAQ